MMDRRAFLQTLFIGAALAGSKPLRAVAAAVEPEPTESGTMRITMNHRMRAHSWEPPLYRVRRADGNGVLDSVCYDQRESDNGQTWVIVGQSNMTVQRGQSDAQTPAPPSGLNRHERRRQARLAR